ncbi:MAG: sugar transferase [Acidimicrobiales bacterium]
MSRGQRLVGLFLFVGATPVMALVAAAIRAAMGPPVLFRQDRVGREGEVFSLVKFRTMRPRSDGGQSDNERLTRIGRFLRRTSLDELPTLWNVAAGDMVLVGPRPLLPEYTDRYDERQRIRLRVKPGITGWCQVRGRNSLGWDEKLALDTWYVEHRTWQLDLRILASTVAAVISGRDIAHAGQATMPEFRGCRRGGPRLPDTPPP